MDSMRFMLENKLSIPEVLTNHSFKIYLGQRTRLRGGRAPIRMALLIR